TVSDTAPCLGVVGPYDLGANDAPEKLLAIPSIAPRPNGPPEASVDADTYYPHVGGGNRYATKCPLDATVGPGDPKYDCSSLIKPPHKCGNGADEENCQVTVLDHYTSSFHWADQNFAAIWLRPQWYLVDNSVLTDVQNGGITFVTSGDY